jgi:hypothetical protein
MLTWDELEVLASSCGLSESARNWLSTVAIQSGIAQSFSDASLAPRSVEDRKGIDGRQDQEGQGAEHKAAVTLQAVVSSLSLCVTHCMVALTVTYAVEEMRWKSNVQRKI